MHAVKRIFRYLKGQPTLGLWYPKDSPLELIAYSETDYAGASIDRKSITGCCQFLGSRLICGKCKKQTIMANSTTKAEYIAASNYYGQSKTNHIEIMHHFIRDSYEKRLIEMVKIHTDYNVADLLTKSFDVTRAMATGKELSNPLMAGSLPKTTLPTKKHTQEPEVHPTESQAEHNIPLPSHSHDPLPSGKYSLKLKELMDLCTNLSNKVLDLESGVLDIKYTYKARIEKLETRVERKGEIIQKREENNKYDADVEINLEKIQAEAYNLDLDHQEKVDVNAVSVQDTLITAAEATKVIVPRKRRGVIIQDPEETTTTTTVTVQPKVQEKDKGKAILIEEPKPLKRSKKLTNVVMKYPALKRKPLTEAQARRNTIVYLKNMAGYKMNYFKGMSYDEIRPFFEKYFNYNQAFLKEVNEGIKVPEQEVRLEKEVEEESSKREDDDDDVYTNATPLASKIPIIDYKIHTERNRPYFKIIRTDGNHRLFLSFSTMLKNFDREDLESLWKFFRETFEKIEPKNYIDDFLLNTLKIMFKKPNVEANVRKDQKGKYGLAKDKSWKLTESCEVHCLTLSTTHIFLLVERMYPLTHFTLEQMINDVILKVKDESEMSLELLRLVRR
uniref:Uncharacterized protein n=1 Tax=Tanacetum cinerariifolium TaxID=118510 RepID=A0A6L2JC95_TANCI|nr:hypothetical protein [Tanacetum cinerariifolium]